MTQLTSTNPGKNYKVVGKIEISSKEDIKRKVIDANKAKIAWKELGVNKRIKLLEPLLDKFMNRKEDLALLITKEIGKPIKEAIEDIEWDRDYFKWFLENGEEYLSPKTTFEDKDSVHQAVYEPIGVAAVIVPWNFPFGNFLWGVIPNLIAGNTVIFKHSEECPLTGKLIEKIMSEANLPKGVFSQVYGGGEVGKTLVNEDVNLIWFTGSTQVGKELYQIAGKKFIKVILEMGGSNPAIVFDDANIDQIVDKIYAKRFSNCGQVCDALKRLIVHKSKFDEVINKLKTSLETKKVGDPQKKDTDIGSLAAKRQLELLETQVKDATSKGAKVEIGGKRPYGLKGAYYEPTILTNVTKDMRVWHEEVFGPVLSVISFDTEQQAIDLANDTRYGLGAQIYTHNKKRAIRVASKIDAGTIDINEGSHWKPCNPFGGYKESGLGREHGKYGFEELIQIKVVAMEK